MVVSVIMSRSDNDDPVGRAGWRHDHVAGRGAMGAGDDHRLAIMGRATVVAVVVGEGGQEKPGGGPDRSAFGGAVVVVLADDGPRDTAQDGVADGIVAAGMDEGGGSGHEPGRAGEREKKAGFHTPE